MPYGLVRRRLWSAIHNRLLSVTELSTLSRESLFGLAASINQAVSDELDAIYEDQRNG